MDLDRKRLTGIRKSAYASLTGQAKAEGAKKVSAAVLVRMGEVVQRRHDVVHNCDRPKTAKQRMSLPKARKMLVDVQDLVYGETPSGACHGIGPRVKRSLEGARREARQTKHHSPRSEHLLLAIATSGGVATKILRRHDVDETRLRDQIAALLPEVPEIAAAIRHGSRRGRRLRRP